MLALLVTDYIDYQIDCSSLLITKRHWLLYDYYVNDNYYCIDYSWLDSHSPSHHSHHYFLVNSSSWIILITLLVYCIASPLSGKEWQEKIFHSGDEIGRLSQGEMTK